MFGLPKHIAPKKLIKSTYVLQKTFINFNQPQFYTGITNFEKWQRKTKNCNILGSKTSKHDHLTIN